MPKFLEVTDKKAARLALEPAFFDARDYGVIADGNPHNNVANLLDCVAQAALVGGTVLLPQGIIDTSEADLGTVTADSGRSYTNTGAISIPHDTPLTITGHGVDATVLKLSAGFQRAFDFVRTSGSLPFTTAQTFHDVTIKNLTVDRDNLSGSDVASQTITLASPLTISGGSSAVIPGLLGSTFANANFIFVESLDKTLPISISGNTVTASNPNATSLTIASGSQTITAALWGHVLAGTRVQGWSGIYGWSLQLNNIAFEDIKVVGAPAVQTANINVQPRDWPFGVGFYLNTRRYTAGNSSAAQAQVNGMRFRRVRIEGCQYGFEVTGDAGTWLDNIWFEDCYHDTGDVPTHYTAATNFFVGQDAWVGTGGVIRCEGHNAWDVALEVDQPWVFWEVDCRWTTANNAFYRTTFTPPARTAAGPPTTLLNGSILAAATTCTVDDLPEDVDREGLAEISSGAGKELVWYRCTNSAGTAWKLWRGVNGSTAVGHSDNAAITFIQVDRTRVHSIRSTITQTESLTTNFGTCWSGFENGFYPLPPLTIRDATVTVVGGNNYTGRFMYHIGWCPEIDIEGLRGTQSDYVGGTAISQGATSAIYSWSRMASAYLMGNTQPVSQATKDSLVSTKVPCPPPLIKGRNNKLVISGVAASAYPYYAVHQKDGYNRWDFDVDVEFGIANASNATAVQFDGGVVAENSRLGVTLASRADQVDASPTLAIALGSSTYMTVASPIKTDIDVTRLAFASDSTDSNYLPWYVDPSQLGNMTVSSLTHSRSTTRKYPAVNSSAVRITSTQSPYTVRSDQDMILVDSTSGAVTVVLPYAAGGSSSLGQPLTRGAAITVVDVAGAANAITVQPAGSEKIDGVAASQALSGNTKTFYADAAAPGWISDAPRALTATSVIGSSSEKLLQFQSSGASSANFVQLENSVSGNPALNLRNSGSANVGLTVLPKGSGSLNLYMESGQTATVAGSGQSSKVDLSLMASSDGSILVGNNLNGAGAGTLLTGTIELGNADTTLSRAAAGVVAVEGVTIPTVSSASTLTQKRIDPRVVSTASASSVTPSIATADIYAFTALAASTLTINAPTGTPVDGNMLRFRVKDNGVTRGLSWDGAYRAIGVTLPTATTVNKTTYVTAIYNSADAKWDVIAAVTEA